MSAVSRVSTIDLIAATLNLDRDRLETLAYENLEPEDGLILVCDTEGKVAIALTDHGIELLKQILADQNEA